MNLQSLIINLRSGELDLLDYLDQLEVHFAEREPDVLAFVPEDGYFGFAQHKRFQRLRDEVRHLLARYPDPAKRPALFGLPIGVKDIFHVDGFTTRAGSQLPPEILQGEEAESVRILRRAGALILGKTVTTEFAYFAPGPTRNPHNLAHTPGGSSSGSAAAVAAGLCPFAFGTQTIGSINRPAAFCGVVGFKPSYGRISTSGVIPLSHSLDHVGFFTNDVAGAELMAGHLCQHWQGSVQSGEKPIVGIPNGPYLQHTEPEGLTHFFNDCDRLAAAGFTIKRVDAMPNFAEIERQHRLLMAAEAARFHAQWFEEYGELYHPKTVTLIRDGQAYSDDDIVIAQIYKTTLRKRLTALMDQHSLDLWISPSATGPAPEGLDSTGNPIMNLPWTNAGLPTLTIPSGFSRSGLPLGLQLAGRWQDDEALLAHGKMIETLATNFTNDTNL